MIAYSRALGGDAASLVSLEADLHLAIERNELRLLFQPIVDLRTGLTVGAEALLRWQHPVEGVLAPDRVPVDRGGVGLIVPITRWVIARAGRIAGDWRKRLDPSVLFYLSVNLSASALRDPSLAEHVTSTLARAQLPASTLKFEITEGGLIENVAGARQILQRLHDMGIELMLGRFRHGLFVAQPSRAVPVRLREDRPAFRRAGRAPRMRIAASRRRWCRSRRAWASRRSRSWWKRSRSRRRFSRWAASTGRAICSGCRRSRKRRCRESAAASR